MNKVIYDHQQIEAKWKKIWQEQQLYIVDTENVAQKDKYYCLDMFPYPSGHGLHVGHWRGYVLSDFYARYNMLLGKTVLHPMGFDSFGLPAENAAIKYKSHPKKFTDEAIVTIRKQLEDIGACFDWSKYLSTSEPSFYRWTQWLFLQLYKHGLAQKRSAFVNWCPQDQTVLANEQVVNGKCERCGSLVTKKELNQWFLKTTEFAEELINDLDDLNWPERVKSLQRDWIGKSTGAKVIFKSGNEKIEAFTTRPDTLFGVTAVVLAPEHPLLEKLVTNEQLETFEAYKKEVASKTNVDRQQQKETSKTAVFSGSYATVPLLNKDVPIWIADYVLMDYGTGAVMCVPAHDTRDYQFAKTHNLEIKQVISGGELPYVGDGKLVNSNDFDDADNKIAAEQIIEKLTSIGAGEAYTNYRLRDWLVSRQRYWGVPIPIVYDPEGNAHPVKEEHLPLLLPEDVDFIPGGESPIARSADYVQLAEKLYGSAYRFETDTLDTFFDSSWYYFRYLSPTDETHALDAEIVKNWMPVDLYIGGIEHATLHLLYARFITKFLSKYGYIDEQITEPFQQLFNIGSINLHGTRMSKSKGNIVSPDLLVEHFGRDALRGYELFIGPMDVEAEWNNRGINGIHRFLIKLYQAAPKAVDASIESDNEFQKYLTNINAMIPEFRLNTVISEAMKFINYVSTKSVSKDTLSKFVVTLSPIFPFICEELWQQLGNTESVFKATWPVVEKVKETTMLKVLINQRFVANMEDTSSELSAKEKALQLSEVLQRLSGKNIVKVIYKQKALINIITD